MKKSSGAVNIEMLAHNQPNTIRRENW